MKNSLVTPNAPLKAVMKVCVTCGSKHSYNQCPLTRGGNDFPTRPPGFHQPTQQNNNQNRFQGNNLNQNRPTNQGAIYQNRPPQNPNFQALPKQNMVMRGKFEAYTTANDANMNNLQLKFDNFQRNQQDFQKNFEQKQDDFQNQMMQFMQNLYNKPSGKKNLHMILWCHRGIPYPCDGHPLKRSGYGQNRPFSVPTDRGYSPSENPFLDAKVEGIFDSGCSRSMTGNKERLDDFQAFQGRKVTFGGGKGRITGKRTIRTPTLDFENVYYVKELQQFNSISQICDKSVDHIHTDENVTDLLTKPFDAGRF
nr:ribonuclease H-like domain-containing protein [Tanacetum cinerariifolium]